MSRKLKRRYSYNKRNRKIRMILTSLILLVVFLGLGYSALSTNLIINGTIIVEKYDPNAKQIDCCNTNGDFVEVMHGVPVTYTVDPATGDVVPTGSRTKADTATPVHSDTDHKALYEQALAAIAQKDALIAELRSQLSTAEKEIRSCRHSMKKACDILMDTTSRKERFNG